MSAPAARASSRRARSSGALPSFTPKFMVAWARWRAQPASRVSATISSYARSAPAPYERWCGQ
ncbi:hypothetical protein STANM309S_01595 [Streptomyces tanashiensis]